ncbi:hypothetical protein [Tautonia marina]|uniref:hypothetical protein n=1 Tax=Tautonia marina TaxID=2653855 RepID=UPI001261065A|nr:hypothetical protein [Tautonia marina]
MSHSPESPRPRWRRRLRGIAVVGLILLICGIAGLPWLVGTPMVRRAIIAQVNVMYAPTVIELEGLSVSWSEPVRLTGVVLRDGNGKAVVSSPTATLNRSLWQLVTMQPDFGTLTLHGASVDIERRADGSIDLAEALGPILAGGDDEDDTPDDDQGPPTRFTLAIDDGTLLLTSPELAEPVTAERLDMTLNCLPAPLNWEIALSNPDARTLEVTGHYDARNPEAAEAVVSIAGSRWPLAVEQAGVVAEGIFGGEVGVRMLGEDLHLTGDAILTQLAVGGPTLKGDQPEFDRIEAAWDLDLATAGVAIRQLDLTAPVATVGLAPDGPDGASKWVGRVDLAALAKQLPNTLALRDGLTLEQGAVDVVAILEPAREDGASPAEVTARIAGLSAREGARVVAMEEPITLSARLLQGTGTTVAVETVAVASRFLNAEGQGDLDEGVTFGGSIDLNALDAQLRQWVDLGEVMLGGSGRFGGDYRRDEAGSSFTARLAVEGQALQVAGLTEEPIVRDAARLDLIVQGSAAPPGVPSGWNRVHVAAKTEGIDAVVDVSPIEEALAVRGRLAMAEEVAVEGGAPVGNSPSLAFDAVYRASDDRLDLAELLVEHAMGTVRASGRIDAVSSARVASLTGAFEPDWDAISLQVAEATEPKARLVGTPRPFRLNGPLSVGSTKEILSGIDAELGVDLTEAAIFGLQVGPAPLVVRCDRGEILIDPIATTLNGGQLVVTPAVELGEDGSAILTIAEGSGIDKVEITDEVSRQVLAYIAPVLREATQVNGRLSVRVNQLRVPLAGPSPEEGGAEVELASRVAFEEVTYGPGPMMQRILGLSGLAAQDVPNLTINQVVDVAISEGRVHQSGLEIVAAEGVALQFEGSVGLDQTLAVRVGVPLSERMLGGQQVLNDVLGGTRVGVPIGGTLGQPKLDQEAFRIGLRQQGGRLIGRGAAAGAGQLLRMLGDEEDRGGQDQQGPANPPPVAPPAEDLLRDVGRGLLRDVIGGGAGRRDDQP